MNSKTKIIRICHIKSSLMVSVLLNCLILFFVGSAFAAEPVVWINTVNVTATGNTIVKSSGNNTQDDAGAISQQSINSQGGYIEFTIGSDLQANEDVYIGLGTNSTNSTTLTEIRYGMYLRPNSIVELRENFTTYVGETNFQVGDVFRISVEGNEVKYYKNFNATNPDLSRLFTSSIAPVFPMILDTSFLAIGSKISNANINQNSSASVCSPNIRADFGVILEPTLPTLPAARGKFCDPTFQTEIMRVTDQNDGAQLGTVYSYSPTFNSNSTRLITGRLIYDFNPSLFTLGTRKLLPNEFDADAQWSSSDAKSMYVFGACCGNPRIEKLNTDTLTSEVVNNFSGVADFQSNDYLWQMSVSADGDIFAFTKRRYEIVNGVDKYRWIGFAVYKASTNQILYNYTNLENKFQGATLDEVRIDKTGRFLTILLQENTAQGYSAFILDLVSNPNTLTPLKRGTPDYAPGHSDYGVGYSIGAGDNDWYSKRNLLTPNLFTRILFSGYTEQANHFSLQSNNEEWGVYSSYDGNNSSGDDPCTSPNTPLKKEIDMVYTLGNDQSQRVRRLAHSRTMTKIQPNGLCQLPPMPPETTPQQVQQYENTPRANISRDGRFIAFTSSWGNSVGAINNTSWRTDLFVLKVPRKPFDFDRDARADLGLFRPSDGVWYQQSTIDFFFESSQFGQSGDKPVPADYDGDGITDKAVFRPSSGYWYWINSSNNQNGSIQFGSLGDVPVQADYDGDGKSDIAIFRPSTGIWYRVNSNDGSISGTQFGTANDIPTIGDFDGDKKNDIAVYRPTNGTWYRLNSGNGGFVALSFGLNLDQPVPGDYTGDGKTDIALYRPDSGTWYILRSEDSTYYAQAFGNSTDQPTPSDYDGDGKLDISVWRPSSGFWYRQNSRNNTVISSQFGSFGDTPLTKPIGSN